MYRVPARVTHHRIYRLGWFVLGFRLDCGLTWVPGAACMFMLTILDFQKTPNAIIIMTLPDISTLSRYVSPINPAVFPHLTLVLLGIGLFFTAWFFVYEVGW